MSTLWSNLSGVPVNRKSAPRQQVVSIQRIGNWGRVEYHHTLACGHTAIRKRASTTEVLACDGCVLAEQHQTNLTKETPGGTDDEIYDPLHTQIAITEKETAIIKAGLVAKFGVPAEAVDLVLGDDEGVLRLQYAVILLSADEVHQYLAPKTT